MKKEPEYMDSEVVVRRFKRASKGKFETRNNEGESTIQTIDRLMNVYADSLEEFQKDKKLSVKDARHNAGKAWLASLPELTDLNSVLNYIALIAWGLRMRIIEIGESKAMMFMAQTQLSALRELKSKK